VRTFLRLFLGLALLADVFFMRGPFQEPVPDLDRRAAPLFAQGLFGFLRLAVGAGWWIHRIWA
jgi:hypothetical protein